MTEVTTCLMCGSNTDDELKLGKLLTAGGVTAHHFCLLFAPGLSQSGKDNEGILGFLIKDIRKESKRVRALRCKFCHKNQSNLGCCCRSCPSSYHTECGLNHNLSFEFSNEFPTFCNNHRIVNQTKTNFNDTCGICLEHIKDLRAIRIPCCNNPFHQTCLQKFANISGVFFKCPLCNDKEKCKVRLPRLGIFLPEKDADWEFDYEEYMEKFCESNNCQSNENYRDSPWNWKLCSTCGDSAVHIHCFTANQNDDFICQSCSKILNKPKPKQEEQNVPSTVKISQIAKERSMKRKFSSWFSDDEQLDELDQENIPKRKPKSPSRLKVRSSPRFKPSTSSSRQTRSKR